MNSSPDVGESWQAKRSSPFFLWLIWIIWLPFLVPDSVVLIQAQPPLPRLVVSLSGVVLFTAIYLWATWRNVQRFVAISARPPASARSIWLPIAVLVGLSCALALGNTPGWLSPFIFTSSYIASRLPPTRALPVLGALVLLLVVIGLLTQRPWLEIGQTLGFVVVVGNVVASLVHSIIADRELWVARDEIARLAVTAERLRIARDLHDLLGHNLALIALKSELAGRLVSAAPERARAEITDIEQVARTTLQEVRAAVSSYRRPTFAGELQAAQEILAAAGVRYQYEGDAALMSTLPPSVEAVLSWTVREGVTNVIRHSHARHCVIRGTRNPQIAAVEISDDGTATAAAKDVPTGNGLRGLAERVTALEGRFTATPCADGGFRLAVSIPVGQEDRP